MKFIQSDITFSESVNIALGTSHWEETCENLSIHYLHHNGQLFSLAVIEDDSDIKCMLTLANHNTNGIYLYINRRPIGSAKHIGEHRRSFGMDIRSLRGKQIDCSMSNHNVKCKVLPVESYENPTVNLYKDNDFHFSEAQNIANNELAKESCCVLVDRVDAAKMPNNIEFVTIESGNKETNLAESSKCKRQKTSMNVGQHSFHNRKLIFEDVMVPKEFIIELEHNLSREMWLGHRFPNRATNNLHNGVKAIPKKI